MATFVHLTPEKHARSIRRAGIKAQPIHPSVPPGVFAMPVVPNFYQSHQWLRELKRRGQRTFTAVYFRIPDPTPVLVGRYNQPHHEISAAEALALLLHGHAELGYEVVIPRSIDPREIRAIRLVNQGVGWRYYPSAHGDRPCPCSRCQPRGEIKSRRIRQAGLT
ncbi:MAG TPA: hypothetical protein VGD58_15875 [Herpetosiphonaceae bacterium]